MTINKNQRILKIYQDKNGKEPIVEWLESMKDIMIKAKIKNRLRRIELGNFGDYRSVGMGIFELRMHFGPGYRIYFGKIDNIVILLLCGGHKKSQTKDIKNAKIYWNDFKNS